MSDLKDDTIAEMAWVLHQTFGSNDPIIQLLHESTMAVFDRLDPIDQARVYDYTVRQAALESAGYPPEERPKLYER